MNNQTKFRAKRIDTGEWVEGWYYEYLRKSYISNEDHSDDADTSNEYEVDPNTVGQFTGLKDKNGKEIFEGDVNIDQYVVEYFRLIAGFRLVHSNGWYRFGELDEDGKIEEYQIIGNIHS